jgi:hypothetical protein
MHALSVISGQWLSGMFSSWNRNLWLILLCKYPERHLVSISPIFYKQLFCMKVFCAAFMCLQFGCVIFWQKDFGAKTAHKMLVKLKPGGRGFNPFLNNVNFFKPS